MYRHLALAGALLVSTQAFAAQKVLGFTPEGQEKGEWCFATVQKLILEHFGSSLEQCDIASFQVNHDCCNDYVKSICDVQSSVDDALNYYGVTTHEITSDDTSHFTFGTVRAEIDADRPVMARWARTDDGDSGGHVIILDGYNTNSGKTQVHTIDSEPYRYAGENGSSGWMDWDFFLQGDIWDVDGNPPHWRGHTASSLWTGLKFQPVCGYDFSELPKDSFGQCWDQRTAQGEWPTTLATSQATMGGSWRANSSKHTAWNVSEATLSSSIESRRPTSRPDTITVWSHDPSAYFDAIWTSSTTPFIIGTSWPLETITGTDADYRTAGYHMTDTYVYIENGTRKYVATWVQGRSNYQFEKSLTYNQLNNTDITNRGNGMCLSRLSTYRSSDGTLMFTALWTPSSASNCSWNYDMTADAYQTYYNTMTNGHYTLKYLSMYQGHYNALFTK